MPSSRGDGRLAMDPWVREALYPGASLMDDEEVEAVTRVMRSRSLFRYYGPRQPEEVALYEHEWAKHIGVRHALAVNSGTSALLCALVACGVRRGDEVIIPAFAWASVPNAVIQVGAVPVVVDIDRGLTIDPRAVEDAIGPKTSAILPVHMRGAPCAIDEITAVATAAGIPIVEDACQAAGVTYRGRPAGSFGLVAAFSTQFAKLISTGEGGAVLTDDDACHRAALDTHDPANALRRGEEPSAYPGLNLRCTEIQAAIGRVQLRRVSELVEVTRGYAARIAETVEADPVLRAPAPPRCRGRERDRRDLLLRFGRGLHVACVIHSGRTASLRRRSTSRASRISMSPRVGGRSMRSWPKSAGGPRTVVRPSTFSRQPSRSTFTHCTTTTMSPRSARRSNAPAHVRSRHSVGRGPTLRGRQARVFGRVDDTALVTTPVSDRDESGDVKALPAGTPPVTRVQAGRDIAGQLYFRIANLALGLVTTIVLVRALGDDLFGQWVTILAVLGLAGSFGISGLSNVAIERAAAAPAESAKWIGALVTLRLALTPIVTVTSLAVCLLVSDSRSMQVAAVAVNTVLLTVAIGSSRIVFQLRVKNTTVSAIDLANGLVWACAVVLVAFLGPSLRPSPLRSRSLRTPRT